MKWQELRGAHPEEVARMELDDLIQILQQVTFEIQMRMETEEE